MSAFNDLVEKTKADALRRSKMHPLMRFVEDIPWWVRYGIWNEISNSYYAISRRLNRAIHGYSDMDWFEYASTNSERAVKLLTLLKEKGHACPGSLCTCKTWEGNECTCKDFERWDAMLDDMIFYHSCVAGQYTEYNDDYKFDMSCEYLDEIKNVDNQKRYRRGKYYYYKYYQNLWD